MRSTRRAAPAKGSCPNAVRRDFCKCRHPRRLSASAFRLCGHEQPATSEHGDPRRLPSGDSGWMAEMRIPPISLKHSPTSGEDERLRSASCPRGRCSSMTRRQASRMSAGSSRCGEQYWSCPLFVNCVARPTCWPCRSVGRAYLLAVPAAATREALISRKVRLLEMRSEWQSKSREARRSTSST